MRYGVGVEHTLHCLVYLVDLPPEAPVGVKELATFQGVSSTYLSKAFTKLAKAGLVRAIPGVKGGYVLARSPELISFWDVVEAIEGATPIFQCTEVRRQCLLASTGKEESRIWSSPCIIRRVMEEAEVGMRKALRAKTLAWLHKQLNQVLSPRRRTATVHWFEDALSGKSGR